MFPGLQDNIKSTGVLGGIDGSCSHKRGHAQDIGILGDDSGEFFLAIHHLFEGDILCRIRDPDDQSRILEREEPLGDRDKEQSRDDDRG